MNTIAAEKIVSCEFGFQLLQYFFSKQVFTLMFHILQRKATELAKSGATSSTSWNPKEDLLTQVLGPDNPGRLRAMGRGMSMSKLSVFQVKNKYMADMQQNQVQLQKQVKDLQDALAKMNNQVRHIKLFVK